MSTVAEAPLDAVRCVRAAHGDGVRAHDPTTGSSGSIADAVTSSVIAANQNASAAENRAQTPWHTMADISCDPEDLWPLFIRALEFGRGCLAAKTPGGVGRSADHGSGVRIAREAPRDRDDDAAEAQQGVEQRLVHGSSRTRGSASCSPKSIRVLRRDTHFYLFCDAETMFVAKPEAERGRLQVLEAAGLGQAHDRHGLPLSRALRVHPLLREGQAAAERSGYRRHHHRAAGPRRLSGGKAGRRLRGPDRSELAAGRDRRRSVHGVGQRRRGGA